MLAQKMADFLIFCAVFCSVCVLNLISNPFVACAADAAIQALESPDPNAKLYGATEIMSLPTAVRVRALIAETSGTRSLELRKQLLEFIKEIDADDFGDELIETFAEWKNGDIREAIRSSFSRSSSSQVVAKLISLAHRDISDERLCRDIARTISGMSNVSALHSLIDGLNSQHISIIAGSAAALANIGNDQAVRGLLSVYPNSEGEAKSIVREAISRLQNPHIRSALAEALLSAYLDEDLRQVISRKLDELENQ